MSHQVWKTRVRPELVAKADQHVDELSLDAKQVLHACDAAELVRLEAYRQATDAHFFTDELAGQQSQPESDT